METREYGADVAQSSCCFFPHERGTKTGRAMTASGSHHAIDEDCLWPRGSWLCLPEEPSGTKLSNLGLARMGRGISPVCLAVDNVRINSWSACELKHRCVSAHLLYRSVSVLLFWIQTKTSIKERRRLSTKKAIFDLCGMLTDLWEKQIVSCATSTDKTWFPTDLCSVAAHMLWLQFFFKHLFSCLRCSH